jgi:probable H4MPT-linked C1 transfer pathway protein
MHVIGLDIGGANIKAATTDGRAITWRFEIWKKPAELASQLRGLLSQFDRCDLLAVTMTAELADCFATKAEGVDFILRAVEQSAGETPIFVWQTGAEFVIPSVARQIPLLAAAANWHALATWLGRMVPRGAALLIDIGSTTTDLIPLLDGVPVPHGLTDRERLQSGELVYSGVRRTPMCAIAHSVPLGDGYCPLAAELFATSLDVYLVLGEISEDSDDRETANGRPATVAEARGRLARMLCCDSTEVTPEEIDVLARFVADVQRQRIAGAVDRVLSAAEFGTPATKVEAVLISGSGSFLGERIAVEHPRLRQAARTLLSSVFDGPSSEAACALAVARLASERLSSVL